MAVEFELAAFTLADEFAVRQFAQPLQLEVNLVGLVDWDSLPFYQHALLVHRDEESGAWKLLVTQR